MSTRKPFMLTPASDTEIVGTRTFDAPRALVFRAWTEPALIMRWLGTPRMPMVSAEVDLRPGGRVRYVWRGADGSQMGLRGVYKEVSAPARLVHTELFDDDWTHGEALVTTLFEETDGRTTVTMTIRYASRAARDAALQSPMEEGMTRTLDALERVLPSLRATVTPFLAFDGTAEAALEHYTSVFPDIMVHGVSRRGADGPLFSATIELQGQRLILLNGGPGFTFGNGISLLVSCETQAEVDAYWDQLGAGGEHGQCGWLKDRFGVSWQIVPRALPRLLETAEPAAAQRVINAMLSMTKLEAAKLEAAAGAA